MSYNKAVSDVNGYFIRSDLLRRVCVQCDYDEDSIVALLDTLGFSFTANNVCFGFDIVIGIVRTEIREGLPLSPTIAPLSVEPDRDGGQ